MIVLQLNVRLFFEPFLKFYLSSNYIINNKLNNQEEVLIAH
jgi:hypothetical protein